MLTQNRIEVSEHMTSIPVQISLQLEYLVCEDGVEPPAVAY